MIQYLYDKDILIYTYAGLGGLGLLIRLIVNLVYKRLVKESDRLGETKSKMLKHLKMKFETCFRLRIGVNNVDTFVDKNVLRYRFCGLLLSTWDNFSGQVLFLNLLAVPVLAVFGVFYECGQDKILYAGAVGILSSSVLILVDKSINLAGKKKLLRLNLLDYLENFCKVRLEQEATSPELIEQYRREFMQVTDAGKQISATTTASEKEVTKDELSRRREARLKKEEERRLQAVRREEEQKKAEEARKEEERKKLEEKKQQAARRREEDRLKQEEEREALEARRAELKRKALEKQQSIELKKQKAENKEELSLEEENNSPSEHADMEMLIKELDDFAEAKERAELLKAEKETFGKEKSETVKQYKTAAGKMKAQAMSQQEEKLIEDVLKEFFA